MLKFALGFYAGGLFVLLLVLLVNESFNPTSDFIWVEDKDSSAKKIISVIFYPLFALRILAIAVLTNW